MPKISETLGQAGKEAENFITSAGDKIENITDDKYERSEECFKKLSEAGVILCFAKSGEKISSYEQIQDITIPRIDMLSEGNLEYCLKAFEDQGIISCDKVPTYTDAWLCGLEQLTESLGLHSCVPEAHCIHY